MSAIKEMSDPVLEVVERTWGFSSLRPLQREAIDASLSGRDTLMVVPTGAGKSLCYQVPALLRDGLTVVVSPLIALMKDQVDGLQASGIAAASLNTTTTVAAQRDIEQALRSGGLRLLFVSPEKLATETMRRLLRNANVRAFAIDEAHCISHWGHDFRPEYRQLRELRDVFPRASIHAFTATATEAVRKDICEQLRLRQPVILVGDLDRPNLRYRVVPRREDSSQVEEVINRHPGDAGIVYCLRRKDVDALAATLITRGYKAVGYHAGMEPYERRRAQEAFASERADIVVATVAFGMGIDRSNVRFVVHAGMPKSLEHYQQEAGRAGRDGLAAECVLLHSPADYATLVNIIERGISSEQQLAIAMKQLDLMEQYAVSSICRHRILVEHFGGTWTAESCDACDVCLGEVKLVDDSTVIAQMILSCIVRLGESFGAAHVASVLRGETREAVISRRHNRLSTYGLLRERERTEIREWISQLIGLGALRQVGHPRPILKLSGNARAILRGEAQVRLAHVSRTATRGDAASEWAGVDRPLFDDLREWRRKTAEKMCVASFVIFSDRVLRDIAAVRPSTLEALRSIPGIGERKMNVHGVDLMSIIDAQCAARNLARDGDAPECGSSRTRDRLTMTPGRAHAIREFLRGATIEEVMRYTARARSTVVKDLASMIEEGTIAPSLRTWVTEETEATIRAAAAEVGTDRLGPIKAIVPEDVTYESIHLVVAMIRREAHMAPPAQASVAAGGIAAS